MDEKLLKPYNYFDTMFFKYLQTQVIAKKLSEIESYPPNVVQRFNKIQF